MSPLIDTIELSEAEWEALERQFPIADEEKFRRECEEATERGRIHMESVPLAVAVRYDAVTGRIVVDLDDGCTFAFPPHLLQELEDVPPEHHPDVTMHPGGYMLVWEEFGAGIPVFMLLGRQWGTRPWMSRIAAGIGRKLPSAGAAAGA